MINNSQVKDNMQRYGYISFHVYDLCEFFAASRKKTEINSTVNNELAHIKQVI